MKFDELVFKRCLTNIYGFKADYEYIFLGNENEDKINGIYISHNHEKQICSNAHFRLSSAMKPIKDMVCIYEGTKKTLTPFNEYSIFQYIECDENDICKIRYLIVDDFYRFTKYPADYFISIEEYNQIKDLDNLNDIIHEKVKPVIEKSKLIEEFPIKEKLIESIYELSECTNNLDNDLLNSNEQNRKLKRLKKDLAIIIDMMFICSSFIAFSPKIVSMVLLVIVIILYILGFLNLRAIKIEDEKEKISDDFRTLNSLEKVNQLPLQLLGKVKLIENNIQILNKLDISQDILKLVYDSINFTTLLIQYESDDNTYKKLDNFLDKTLEYVKTLKENKFIEEEYIKRELANNINSLIDRNSAMFESMVEDNKYLIDQFK